VTSNFDKSVDISLGGSCLSSWTRVS